MSSDRPPVSVWNCRALSSKHGELAISRLVTRRRKEETCFYCCRLTCLCIRNRPLPPGPSRTCEDFVSHVECKGTRGYDQCLAALVFMVLSGWCDSGWAVFQVGIGGEDPQIFRFGNFCNLSMSIVDGNRWKKKYIYNMRTPKYIKRVSPRSSRWSFTNFQAGSLLIYFGVSIVQYDPSWCMISLVALWVMLEGTLA